MKIKKNRPPPPFVPETPGCDPVETLATTLPSMSEKQHSNNRRLDNREFSSLYY
jgi:hypothetical protein